MTPIHRALGREPSSLSYELVVAAVDASLVESDSLEWKSGVAADGDEPAREFAKDVAMMANAVGGLIVIGVKEDREHGAAERITPVDISEVRLRRLRQWAAMHVRPIVATLDISALPSPDDPSVGLIAVMVPASVDAPHLVSAKDGGFRVPVRYGAQTRWLAEQELAEAYATRFRSVATMDEHLREAVAQGLHGLDRSNTTWIVAAAVPETRARAGESPVTPTEFVQIVEDAIGLSIGLALERGWSPLIRHRSDMNTQRLGLRRRIFEDRTGSDVAAFGESLRVELHDSGAIVLCLAAFQGPAADDQRAYVETDVVETFAQDLVGLIGASASRSGYQGRYAVRVEMCPASELALGLRAYGPYVSSHGIVRGHGVLPGTRAVYEPIPIVTTVEPGEQASRVRAATSIALDVLHQFSVATLTNTVS